MLRAYDTRDKIYWSYSDTTGDLAEFDVNLQLPGLSGDVEILSVVGYMDNLATISPDNNDQGVLVQVAKSFSAAGLYGGRVSARFNEISGASGGGSATGVAFDVGDIELRLALGGWIVIDSPDVDDNVSPTGKMYLYVVTTHELP